MPRLLFLAHSLPYPPDGGAFIRTYNVLRLLSRSYEIRLLAFDRTGEGGTSDPGVRSRACTALSAFADVTVVPVPQGTSRFRYLWDHIRSFLGGRQFTYYRHDEPRFSRLINEALSIHSYDIVHVDSLDLARFLPLLPLERLVLTHHNVESELLRDRARRERLLLLRAYVLRQARLQERAESYWCPRVSLNVAVSNRDAGELKRIAPGSRVTTVPNGVDVSKVRPNADSSSEIVCVGGLGWFPNQDALEYLCEEILPLFTTASAENVTWVGRAAESQIEAYRNTHGVRLTGYLDSVLPIVESAACYVLPFRLGGGTRLKLLEAMAAGRAIVSTSVGAMGVDAEHGRHLLIADTPEEFTTAIERVLADDDLRQQLGHAARGLVEQVYDWEAIGDRMTLIYGRIG